MNSSGDSSSRVRSPRELQQDIEPARDLWPAIEARLAPRRSAWIMPASLAASVLLVSLALLVGYRVHDAAMLPAAQLQSAALLRAALAPDMAYERDREKMLAALPAKLAQLPPETQQDVRDSLASIQQAMQVLQLALGGEVSNTLLQELLIRTQREEMRLLTTVEELDGFNPEI